MNPVTVKRSGPDYLDLYDVTFRPSPWGNRREIPRSNSSLPLLDDIDELVCSRGGKSYAECVYVCVSVLLSKEKTCPRAAGIETTSGRKIRGEHVSVRKTGFFAMEMEYPSKLSITVSRGSFSCSKVGLERSMSKIFL